MQAAESGLDRELPVFRYGYYLKNLPDALTFPDLPIPRAPNLPIPDVPISRSPDGCRSAGFQLLNYHITQLPNRGAPRLIPRSKALS
jgi:hypothetical protein